MKSKINEKPKLTTAEVEAANRAEVTALLIRAGYRVYRPEADCYGEDLILRNREGTLLVVQLKARPEVDKRRYLGLWMLFPGPKNSNGRKWFLVPHDEFYIWTEARHGQAPKWREAWSYPNISKELGLFLSSYNVTSSKKSI